MEENTAIVRIEARSFVSRGNDMPETALSLLAPLMRGGSSHGSRTEAMNRLADTYYPHLVDIVCRNGVDKDAARDHVQDFFLSLAKDQTLEKLDLGGKRLRDFLVRRLKYQVQHHKVSKAREKRGGRLKQTSFTKAEDCAIEPHTAIEADYRWARLLVGRAHVRLAQNFRHRGQEATYDALVKCLPARSSIAHIVEESGLSEAILRQRLGRMREAFRRAMVEEIGTYVHEPKDILAEAKYIASLTEQR